MMSRIFPGPNNRCDATTDRKDGAQDGQEWGNKGIIITSRWRWLWWRPTKWGPTTLESSAQYLSQQTKNLILRVSRILNAFIFIFGNTIGLETKVEWKRRSDDGRPGREQMLSDQPNWPLSTGYCSQESSGANEIRRNDPQRDEDDPKIKE